MRLPRLRLRTHLLIVAIFAVLLWAGMLASRSVYYRFLARWSAAKQQAYLNDTHALERRAGKPLSPREVRLAEYGRRMVSYLSRQRARYESIARQPWLSIEPDPPLPEWREP